MKFPLMNLTDAEARLQAAEDKMDTMNENLAQVVSLLELILDELRKP